MGDSRNNTWSSSELHRLYTKDGGTLSRRYLIQKISKHFGDELVVLFADGVANIIMFKSHASSLMYMETEDDDDPISVAKIAKKIAQEVKEIDREKGKYRSEIDFDIASEDSSPTLSFLLSEISSTLRQSLPSLLIQNIVTSSVCNRSTTLQIALAVLIGVKQLTEHLYDYSITCSCNEFLRYRTSAAFAHNKNRILDVLSRNGGLVQVVADNFDLISSQNGLKQTHDLAMILIQYSSSKKQKHLNFTRLPKLALKDIELDDTPITFYKGPKKPKMPLHKVTNNV